MFSIGLADVKKIHQLGIITVHENCSGPFSVSYISSHIIPLGKSSAHNSFRVLFSKKHGSAEVQTPEI